MVVLYELACSCQEGTILRALPGEIGKEILQKSMVGGHVLLSKQKFAVARRRGMVAEDMLPSCKAFATPQHSLSLAILR